MFRPVALYIGLRYTRAKRRNHFISFISATSMIGIALGVAVLITVLAVMSGFDREIKGRVFSMAPHIRVSTHMDKVSDWSKWNEQLATFKGVQGTAPYITGQGMLTRHGQVHPIMISGVDPAAEANVSELSDNMVKGSLSNLKSGEFGIIVGQELSDQLGLIEGDKVTLVVPEATVTPAGIIPRFKRFTIAGIFEVGAGFGFEKQLAFIHLGDAQKLFKFNEDVSGIRLKLNDLYQAPEISYQIYNALPKYFQVTNWTQDYGAYFNAVKLEKTMMFFILMLIIAVAVFNLVSTLVMVVNDKQSDIAILRTFGATPGVIMGTFMVQGCIVGFIGTLLGLVGGVLLAENVAAIVNGIESLFNMRFLSSSVYVVDNLPSEIIWSDVFKICIAALVMSLVATIYPAWKAARTEPVEALRYE